MTIPTDPFHELARRIPAPHPDERLFTIDYYGDHRDLRFPARVRSSDWPAFRPEVAVVVVDWINALHAAEPTSFDSAVWHGHTILLTLTDYAAEGPIAIDPDPDGLYSGLGAATGWDWNYADPTTGDPATAADLGTPTFDALVAERAAAADTALPPDRPPLPDAQPAGVVDGAMGEAPAILTLFGRLKAIEESDGGWPGADVVSELCAWFAELGIDVDADPAAAAQTLRLPTHPQAGEVTVRIHSGNVDVNTTVDSWVRALVTALGPDSSAAVFDTTGRQTAHTHPATDPSQP